MDIDRYILILLQQFGFSDIDENALNLLREVGNTYFDLCARKSGVQPSIVRNFRFNLSHYALQNAGMSINYLLKYNSHYDYLSDLQQPYQAQKQLMTVVPSSKVFTGDMTEKLNE
ncbi:hypothetical protein SS50377_28059 [Spironucleus salmonicida]|uniref:Uncharacterized protein n=1 Tax=Spironucleus salmonicida TaxID=348837 RepID=V6LFX9_9EUKA|nr:hypothetical protein SS50377_28059 [Spironucleus salmonicida]|eukprot:EST42611.1 Hypothetical protein SS50377_17931 [Spironucleus salmonicida]